MAAEDKAAKAARYIAEGRVRIEEVGPSSFSARVRGGNGAVYRTWFAGDWRCDCPSRLICSHILAVQQLWEPPAGNLLVGGTILDMG